MNYDKRQALFELLNKLGIQSAPGPLELSLQAVLSNYGQPDHMIMDKRTLEAYMKLFKK